MPNPFPNNTALAKCVFQMTLNPEHKAIVTFGAEKGAAGDAATLAINLASSWSQAGALGNSSMISENYTFKSVAVTLMLSGVPHFAEINVDNDGTSGLEELPLNNAVVVQKRTALGGRKGRGRMFLPPIYFDESAVSRFGNISPGTVSDVQDMVDVVKTHMNTTLGIDMLLFHNDGVTAPSEVTELIVESTIATQRRRLRR